MVAIGDVFGVIGTLAGICITACAMIMGAMLAFPGATDASRNKLEQSPIRSFLLGVGIVLTIGLMAVIMVRIPNPLIKLFGTTLYLSLMAVGALGAGGLSMKLSSRLRALQPELSPYAALVKADAIMVVACLFPLLGWFLIAPITLLTCLGSGAQGMFARNAALVSKTQNSA